MEKQMKKRIAALLAVLTMSVAVGIYLWFFWSPCGRIIKGREFEGLVIQRDKRTDAKEWDIPARQILELESKLAVFVTENPSLFRGSPPIELKDFRRYYFGVERDGSPFIAVRFYRKSYMPRRKWLDGILFEGGAAVDHWSIGYSPDSQSFSKLYPFPVSEEE